MTKSQSLSFSSSISKSSKSDNKLIRLTLDNIKGNFSTSRSLKSSEIMEKEENQTYTGKLSYGYSFGRDNYVKPFGWMNSVPFIGKKMSELTKEEREKENLIDEIERALHALVSNDICNLPMPTPEEIQSKKELCKIILDELNKADESKKK